MFKYIFLFCSLCSLAFGQDYFIHLSTSGFSNKTFLLNNQIESIPSLNKAFFAKTADLSFREAVPQRTSSTVFEKWLVLQSGQDSRDIIQNLSDNNLIDFFEPVGQFKIDFESTDSLASEQWYLDKINVQQAWQITKGKPEIIISVIDTGFDFIHPDLQQALWINDAEDLNGNAMLDAEDINNIDDDGNGYIDDVIGWDFTDAPRFPDGGDYLDEDNEPWDEYGSGHGTQAAGIIAAQDNNSIGIAGIAPQLKLMNLRAGTASGYLEEDDVGRAILYALQNGARIINMSFGDQALSRFLRDVISYASEQGVIFISSSGNDNSSVPHYPSSLAQVISVGASTKNDGIAGYSNYGNSLDIVAPGSEMVSTAVGGKYNSVSGTSFSAPVVSAVAGLILSQNSALTADQLRNILKTSSDDIYYQGWDSLSAAGRVSAYKALRVPQAGILKITSPSSNSSVATDKIIVMGSALHPDLLSTQMQVGTGEFPAVWIELFSLQGQQIYEDTLAVFDAFAGDTTYTLRLKMNLLNSKVNEIRHTFRIDKTAPEISNVKIIDMWDGPQESKLISFETDDICTVRIYIRRTGSAELFKTLVSPYETVNHRFKIDKKQFEGVFDFYIEAENSSRLSSIADNNGSFYSFSLNREMNRTQFTKVPWTLPAGFICDRVSDFDHDGNKEIIISRYDIHQGFGPIAVYEFNNGQFDLRLLTGFTAIPRAAGDVDKDGLGDLLLGFGQNSFLFEALNPNSFPSQLIWQDTLGFWVGDYTDIDGDNILEITGRIDNEYVILENSSDNTFVETGRLTNTTEGENRLGVPNIELADLNNNGVSEIIFGDYDGDLLTYSSAADNDFFLLTSSKTVHQNAVELLTSDSNQTVFTATHTSDNLNFEHEFDARYWSIEAFSFEGEKLISKDTINTFGFSDTRDFDSGIQYFNFDEKEYLFAAFFPHLYVFEKSQNNWNPVWYYDNARSNTVLVYDFDNDGNDEFYFNDGRQIIGFSSFLSDRPASPLGFNVEPLDTVSVLLRWQAVSAVQNYNIYRGTDKGNLLYYSSSGTVSMQDTVTVDKKYYYAVSTVDSTYSISESYYSSIDSVKTISPPSFTGYEFSGDKQLLIQFDKTLWLDPDRQVVVKRGVLQDYASSVLVISKKDLLVSFAQPFVVGAEDSIIIENVFGETGVPLTQGNRTIAISFDDIEKAPYIKSSRWFSAKQMLILFSEPMDFANGPLQFDLEPSGRTENITVFDSLSMSITVDFSSDSYIGASGKASYLVLEGIRSKKGVELSGINRISLYKEVNGLKDIKVYPQPLKPKHSALFFANLPGNVDITIYNIRGQPVKHLSSETLYGGVSWDLKDDDGHAIASGVYVFNMTWNNKSEQGKIVIVR